MCVVLKLLAICYWLLLDLANCFVIFLDLKKNICYHKSLTMNKHPIGAVMLFKQNIKELENEASRTKPNQFIIQGEEPVPLYLAADTEDSRTKWVEVLQNSVSNCQALDAFLEETKEKLTLAPSAINNPDCFGYLIKLGTQWKSWSRRYCVLKNAALYFYNDSNATCAFGVALLHGYRVQQSSSSKKYAFEILPPDTTKKYYYFRAESDTDKRRWMSALEYSIDRWLKLF